MELIDKLIEEYKTDTHQRKTELQYIADKGDFNTFVYNAYKKEFEKQELILTALKTLKKIKEVAGDTEDIYNKVMKEVKEKKERDSK